MANKKLLLVTPRTHPNLRYWIDHLSANGWEPTLIVDKVTKDFSVKKTDQITTPAGLGAANLDLSAYDVVIWRHYPKALRGSLGAFQPCRVSISYDQKPVGSRPLRVFVQESARIKRVLLRRPGLRISPTLDKGGLATNRGSVSSFYFRHPSPEPGETSARRETTPVVAVIAKQFNRRKRTLLALKAIGYCTTPVRGLLISSSQTIHGYRRSGFFERWYERKLRNYVSANPDLISAVADLSQPEVLAQLSSCHLFLLPSKREDFSISNIEANSVGLVSMISSDNGSFLSSPSAARIGIRKPTSPKLLAKQIDSYLNSVESWPQERLRVLEAYKEWLESPSSLGAVLENLMGRAR